MGCMMREFRTPLLSIFSPKKQKSSPAPVAAKPTTTAVTSDGDAPKKKADKPRGVGTRRTTLLSAGGGGGETQRKSLLGSS